MKRSKGELFKCFAAIWCFIRLTLPSLLLEVQQKLGDIQKGRKDFRGRVKQLTKATSIQAELAGYKSRFNELRTNFTVSHVQIFIRVC